MPKINIKTFEEMYEDDRNLAIFYTPEWRPSSDQDFGIALLKIFAHMKEEIVARLNRIPERNFTAFLNMLGMKLVVAQPSRVPVTFYATEGLDHGIFIPAGTQVVAPASEKHESLTFETTSSLTATSSPIIELFSADPEMDAIYSHTAAFNKKEMISLFKGENLQSHVLYLGHSRLFKVGPSSNIKLKFKLSDKGSFDQNLLEWQCWTEKGMIKLEQIKDFTNVHKSTVKYEKIQPNEREPAEIQIILTPGQDLKETEVNGIGSLWIACSQSSIGDPEKQVVLKDIKISEIASVSDKVPDMAFYNFVPLNLDNVFYPFGKEPRLFDTFYIASKEAFSKKNANIAITFRRAKSKADSSLIDPKANSVGLSFEYWNGKLWRDLTGIDNLCFDSLNNLILNDKGLNYEGKLTFTNPIDIQEIDVCGETNYWIRIRLINGDYGREEIKENLNNFIVDLGEYYNHFNKLNTLVKDEDKKKEFDALELCLKKLKNDLEDREWIINKNYTPPWLNEISINYSLTGSEEELEHCLSYNNLEYRDLLKEQRVAKHSGMKEEYCIRPFLPLPESYPTIHMGFKGPLGRGKMSIFFSLIQGIYNRNKQPNFEWSYWSRESSYNDDLTLKKLNLETIDNTDHLSRSDTLEFLAPADQVGTVRFGKDCFWLMGTVTTGQNKEIAGSKDLPDIKGIYSNTVWAEQVETIKEEILGSSNGEKGLSFSFMRIPVLFPEIWVREGAVILKDDQLNLSSAGLNINEIKDENGKVVDAWVEWKAVEDFYSSNPKSRHCLIDGSSGKVSFGDGNNGMITPIGKDNIKANYKSGGGVKGNLSIGEISAIKTPLAGIDRVTNNDPSEGGSDTETLEQIFERGPHRIRSMDRAVTEEDFERLAKASSSFIARTKCFLDVNDNRLKVVVIPKGEDDRPKPSAGLLRVVERYIDEKRLGTISSDDLQIMEPTYKEVSVVASIIPESIDNAVPLEQEIRKKLKEFLHPLTGGSDGRGWEFGRDLHISEIYALLEGISGVDHVKDLQVNGSEINPVTVAEVEMVCSGDHKINIVMDGETGR